MLKINITKQTKHLIILYTLMAILLISLLSSIKKCAYWSDMNYDNITALTDTIKYYKGRSEQLIAQKTILTGDMNTMKQLNDSLYNIIKKDMKVSNPGNIIYINTTIKDTVKKDTCWVIKTDTLHDNIYNIRRDFDFSDRYRTLKGYTYYNKKDSTDNMLGTAITENSMAADFTVVQKDNKVYISSSNPYIQYNSIIGVTNNNNANRKYRFGIGPYIGYGIIYTDRKLKFGPSAGISLYYNLFSF